ncbi:MAG: vanadium-dependent haloperoxidase [Desulfobacterales bacterium]|nr:vanadium-dependent haloperoxidase [Desulfobacterales bacterium]MDJ0855442.1 vanadium-dependent haloperoxidase [Desulfobacterales bacterium]MDJ0990750.1 vanadium-dependent haloperoxidase [Desulfobacterales bacterium]
MSNNRQRDAMRIRISAAEMAADRPHPIHHANGDEQRYASANYPMSFTKGLAHEPSTGLVADPQAFESFRTAVDEGYSDAFTTSVRASADKARAWEAPTAGVVYELSGPDPQAVTMSPAPALGTLELAYEMAEVYELALIRDVPLIDLAEGTTNTAVLDAVSRLNAIGYALDGTDGRPRLNSGGDVTPQNVFRGSSPGVDIGPYLSQFMLIGNDQPGDPGVAHGRIQYGALQIDQRVPVATAQDYLIAWSTWLQAQNGEDLRDNTTLFDTSQPRRFMTFPRDLATYVHDDALYEAYLNACLILLSMGTPFDPGFAKLSGQGELFLNSLDINGALSLETHARQAGGFALYGGPHILTLVTEVATRALKAVRYQKFNNHLRLRPEALAGRIDHASQIASAFPAAGAAFADLRTAIDPTVTAVEAANTAAGASTALLPMAFQEGSPMHPSYGAGHATVAGACVTVLKAFFDTGCLFVRRGGEDVFNRYQSGDTAVAYTPGTGGSSLVATTGQPFLTLEGELNKLAANISIGRNMAGVHYFSDYYDSLRMGEAIAIGILEEQALCYPTDPFVMSVPTFDGEVYRIGNR